MGPGGRIGKLIQLNGFLATGAGEFERNRGSERKYNSEIDFLLKVDHWDRAGKLEMMQLNVIRVVFGIQAG